MIHRHEAELRINFGVHHGEVQAVTLLHRLPVLQRSAAQRINADAYACRANRVQVNHLAERIHIGRDEIVEVRVAGLDRRFVGLPANVLVAATQEFVCPSLHPVGDVRVRRAAVGRIIFEPAILRRIVRWRDDESVAESVLAPAIVGEDRVGDGRGGRKTIVALDKCFHAVGREDFERGALRGRGRGVRILAHEQRPADAFALAVFADGLRDRENVRLGERAVERRAAMPARAKADELVRIGEVGGALVVITFELRGVNEQRSGGRFSGEWTQSHARSKQSRRGGVKGKMCSESAAGSGG